MILRRHLFMMALQRGRFDGALQLVRAAKKSGQVRSAALYIRHGKYTVAESPAGIYLLASITKPMTAAAVMLLSDRGQLKLDDPVVKFIPECKGADRASMTIRHLLTHSSGLPDMLPENDALRKRHAPLREWVALTCKTPLLFAPGTEVRYQSMGILLAAEIAERIVQTPLRDFLDKEIFKPLGMRTASLGLGGRAIPATEQCEVSGNDDWNWNSPYWRNLGAPWGGAHAAAADVAKFLEFFLNKENTILRAETKAAMVSNQTAGLNEPRGLGFMVKPGSFGVKCSPSTFGHYGSTGTVAWADPKADLVCVLLTTKPADSSRANLLGPVSDRVSESV